VEVNAEVVDGVNSYDFEDIEVDIDNKLVVDNHSTFAL
jgi:hypothetical protein